jgi:AcrR family transcriptional regulator
VSGRDAGRSASRPIRLGLSILLTRARASGIVGQATGTLDPVGSPVDQSAARETGSQANGGFMARMSSADRRFEIMQAALRVIAANGVSAATTRAIVAEAGMSLASFHYAFDSRDEMMHEFISFVVDNQTVAAAQTIQRGGDIRSTVRGALQAFFDVLVADPGHEQVMFELMHFALRTPGLEQLPRRQYESYRLAAAQLLRAAEDSCDIRWTLPVAQIAAMIVTITDGITLAWLADRDRIAAAVVMDFAADSIAALARPLSSTDLRSTQPRSPAATAPATTITKERTT